MPVAVHVYIMNDTDGDTRTVTVITGASSGIGAATARQLAHEGSDLVLAARSVKRLEDVAAECRNEGVEAAVVPTNVTEYGDVESLIEATRERFGRLDAVVVNAGTGEQRDRQIEELPLEQFETVTATNVHGAFYTTRAALPALREHGGTIVFVGSYKGRYPSTSTPVYAASKWWLRGFAKSVAGQVGSDGVGVSVVNPTGVRTEFGSQFRAETNNEALEAETTVSADDVAEAITYAIDQDAPTVAAEIDLYRQDVYERF